MGNVHKFSGVRNTKCGSYIFNKMQLISLFIIKRLFQHVSGIIMPIVRRIRPCPNACGVLYWLCRLWLAEVLWICVVPQHPINPLTSNDPYKGRTAPLTSKLYILHIYSTNTVTEYFKNVIYSPSFSLQNAVCFIILTYLVPVLFIFYIQDVLKLKKNNSGAKRLI